MLPNVSFPPGKLSDNLMLSDILSVGAQEGCIHGKIDEGFIFHARFHIFCEVIVFSFCFKYYACQRNSFFTKLTEQKLIIKIYVSILNNWFSGTSTQQKIIFLF